MATRGDLPLQFSWLLDDAPLNASLPNIKITIDDFSSHISISSLTEAHDATYSCLVSNKGGSVKNSARLQVKRKPSLTNPSLANKEKYGNLTIR